MSITLDCFDEQSMQEIEYLLAQSTKGLHLLFNSSHIKSALQEPVNGIQDFDKEDRNKVQNVFGNFIEKNSFAEKEEYLAQLNEEDRELLIKAYFHIVENTIKRTTKLVH